VSTVLVTGSAGFVGGYVVKELLSRGHTVIGLDNYSKYGRLPRSYDEHPAYQFVEGDARDADVLTGLLTDCDHFIACAAMIGGISYFHALAYDLLATNERIMAATCDAAIAAHSAGRLQKVTYISSSMVYESADHWPFREGDEKRIPAPHSSYGFQKLAVEYYARAAWDQYQLPYTIVRPFNCVGNGDAGDIKRTTSHVVPDLVKKLITGQDPLHILGDGTQVRHYTYGGDLARGIAIAMESEKALNEDFNISSTLSTTVHELAELIWHKIKGPDEPPRIVHDDPFQHDVRKRVPDVSKARDVLGFEATTTLDQMLDEVIPWVAQAVRDGRL